MPQPCPSRCRDVLALALLAVWGAEASALAYVDPGSGGLVWQAVIAALVGAAFHFRGHLGRLFSRNRRQDPPADNG
jgi:hypothetical protein